MNRKHTAPRKSSGRPMLFFGLLVFFALVFVFARQSIEDQHVKFRISMLAEQKMAKMDDLRVLNVEIARLESAARIDQKVRDLELALAPASLPPIQMRSDIVLTPAPTPTHRNTWLAYARSLDMPMDDEYHQNDLGERDDLR